MKIDRSVPFYPVAFLGKEWSIEEQDERALILTRVCPNNVRLEKILKPSETCVNGEERLKRLKMAGRIRLDAKIFQTLWDNKHLIPEEWKEKTNGDTTFIFFDGTVLQDPHGNRYVLCLFWRDGCWRWRREQLDISFKANYLSAVLVS